jgi:hypothetical protein
MNYIRYEEKWIDDLSSKRGCLFLGTTQKTSLAKDTVHYWLLEIDDKGKVHRELGININHQVVCKAPYKEDRGQWVDSNILVNPEDFERVLESLFDKMWEALK